MISINSNSIYIVFFLLSSFLSSLSFAFDYKSIINKTTTTISINAEVSKNQVTINGADTAQPSMPFQFDWGDGNITSGWFPQSHVYLDNKTNYIVTVTSYYNDGTSGNAQTLARFGRPVVEFQTLPNNFQVSIPNQYTSLQSTMTGYTVPNLSYFDDSYFSNFDRKTAEYVLSVAAGIEADFANDNIFRENGLFNQVVLLDSKFTGGAYAIWFSDPVALAAGPWILNGDIAWSSLFHEMGHNVTLNSPKKFRFGGKIDGNANAIFSETMAQIFQHAAGYEIINNAFHYGLPPDLVFEIEQDVLGSASILKNNHEIYLSSGSKYIDWNPYTSPTDPTVSTFMTLAYRFLWHAEAEGIGYREPLKRMMSLLQTFDPELENQYGQNINSNAASTFRATLMVTAMSYGFQKDLRSNFKTLNFPIDDHIYDDLLSRVGQITPLSLPNSTIATHPKPLVSFNVNLNPVNLGSSASLSWTSANATSCSASGGWKGNLNLSGSQATDAILETQTYILTCTGQGGSVSQSVTINPCNGLQILVDGNCTQATSNNNASYYDFQTGILTLQDVVAFGNHYKVILQSTGLSSFKLVSAEQIQSTSFPFIASYDDISKILTIPSIYTSQGIYSVAMINDGNFVFNLGTVLPGVTTSLN